MSATREPRWKHVELSQRWAEGCGRSTVRVWCPWCLHHTRCYIWSLSGSGKLCECGALLCSMMAREPNPVNDA